MSSLSKTLCSFAVSILLAAAAPGAASANAGVVAPSSQPFVTIDAFAQTRTMHRGMNVLSADPMWNDPAKARFQTRHFARLHDAGFDLVRMNLQSFRHMDAAYQLDPVWLATLDTMVRAALDNDLTVVLSDHDSYACSNDSTLCKEKLGAFWRQIGAHFENAPNRLLFEILNEPHDPLDATKWNGLLRDMLAVIRATNPTRNVVIGPAGWSNIDQLSTLDLPADDSHIIVTVHYYFPMQFTHQGARWVESTKNLSGVKWGSDAERARLAKDFDSVKAWSDAQHRPIYLGEFGSYERGDIESRMRYDGAVARAAEARGFPWSYWQFDSDFVAYDMVKDDWVQAILYALIPQK